MACLKKIYHSQSIIMKTHSVLALVLSVGGYCLGQSPTIVEYGPTTSGKMETNHTEIKTALNELLTKATKQLEALDKQLQRTGDYMATVRADSGILEAQDAMAENGVTSVKTNAELATIREAAKGDDVFNPDSDEAGVFKSISTTYQFNTGEKDKDGNFIYETRNRDGKEYTNEGKKLADLKEFYRVRDEAITKQKNLEDARIEAHTALLETEDAVETQRLSSLISSIDAELIAVRQDVANASHELEMHEKAIQLQQVVDAKSKQEDLGRKSTSSEDIADMVKSMIDAAKARSKEDKKRGRLEERKETPDPEETPEL